MADKKISQLTELVQANVDVDADFLAIVDSSATETKKVLVDSAVLATLSQSSVPSINGTTIPTSKTLVVTTDIGVSVQAYDADTAKYDDATANFTGTLQNSGSNVVVDTDIGSTVQAYDADTAKYDDATANFTGTLQNGGSNVLVDTDIGVNVQAYDADTAKYDDATANFTGTLQNGGHTVLTDASDYLDSADIGVNVLAYDSNLQAFVTAVTLPETDGSADQVLVTNGSGTVSWADQSGGAVATTLTVENRAGTGVSVPLTNGNLPVTNRAGSTVNVPVS